FNWSVFKNCPLNGEVEGLKITKCNVSATRIGAGGSYTVGNITVPVTKQIVLQGGFTKEEEIDGKTHMTYFIPPENGALAIAPVAEPVPVEVLGNVSEAEMNEFNWPQGLRESYKLAQKKGFFKAGKTKEIIEPAGKDQDLISQFNLLLEEGPTIVANVQI